MNPTLSLSAAEAPNRPAPVASTAAVAAMRILRMHFSVLLTGETSLPMRGAPSRALRARLPVGHEHGPKRRWRSRAAGSCTRNQDKDNDGREIWQCRHQLRGYADAPALRMQLKYRHRAEQIGADHQAARQPRCEHDQRQRDPPAACGHAGDEEG